MEDWQRNHIRENLPDLVRLTRCDAMLLGFLISKGVLSKDDEEYVKMRSTQLEQARGLYDALFRKHEGYNKLLLALYESGQSGAAKILEDGTKKYNSAQNQSEDLVVGYEPCTFGAICDVLSTCKSAASLWSKLVDVSRSLSLPEDRVLLINPWLISGIKTHESILFEILGSWRAKESANARLSTLLSILESKGLKDCADELRYQFSSPSTYLRTSLSEFKDPKVDQRNIAILKTLTSEVPFQGSVVKLQEIFDGLETDTARELAEMFLIQKENPELLLSDTLPEQINYYIARQITSRSRLNPVLLEKPCEDVFVIKGIPLHRLSQLAYNECTDKSSRQLDTLTVRIIALEYEQDFENISKISKSPVHLLEHNAGHLHFIRSYGNLSNLQEYVLKDKDQISLDEEEFVKVSMEANNSICISDTPGMGKTLLLANIARKIMSSYPNRLIRFIVLHEFISKVQRVIKKGKLIDDCLVELIATHASEFEFERKLVRCLLTSKTNSVVIMFDGYDEVLKSQTKLCHQILNVIKKWKSVKLFVATRPHMRDELENTLGALGYNILAFRSLERIDFLTRYWLQECGPNHQESHIKTRLENFAENCLTELQKHMNDFEREIAGIPLQCSLLANVYMEDAIKYCNSEARLEGFSIRISSIFEVYRKLVEMRFNKAKPAEVNILLYRFFSGVLGDQKKFVVLTQMHMYVALKLLFPEQYLKFKNSLVGQKEPKVKQLCAVGILEKKESCEIAPRFVHRTFAEYFIGQFTAEVVGKKRQLQNRILITSNFLSTNKSSDNMLTLSDFTKCESIQSANFQNPVMCFFANAHLKHSATHSLKSNPWGENYDSFYDILAACIIQDLPALFVKILESDSENQLLKQNNFRLPNLLYLSAKYTGFELFKLAHKKILECVGSNKISFKIPNTLEFMVTPLHVAVERGHFTIAEFYLKSITKEEMKEYKYLMHCCVAGSKNGDEGTLRTKTDIIQVLVMKHKVWLNEPLPDGTTPILCSNIHIKLFHLLLEMGADSDAISNKETVLHKLGQSEISPETFHEVLILLVKHEFSKFNTADSKGRTFAHVAAQRLELLKKTIMEIRSQKVNLNEVDELGDSVLFYAVRGGRSVDLIKTLVSQGCDINHKNCNGENVLHVCAKYRNHLAMIYLLQIQEIRPSDIIAENNEGLIPFAQALFLGRGSNEAIIMLMEHKGLQIDEQQASDALKGFICNNNITVRDLNFEFVYVADYLISKGGTVKCESRNSPWQLEEMQKNIQNIIEATKCNSTFLKELRRRGVLNEEDSITFLNAPDSLFAELQNSKKNSWEISCISLVASNQTKPFTLMRQCLINTVEQNKPIYVQ